VCVFVNINLAMRSYLYPIYEEITIERFTQYMFRSLITLKKRTD